MRASLVSRYSAVVLICGAAFLILIGAPFFGAGGISFGEIFASGSIDFKIFWGIRVPRVLLGFLVGAALAISGMSFQAIFRNPLATPFILGVSAGASLGVAIYINLGLDQFLWDGIFAELVKLSGFEKSWLLPSGKMIAAFFGAAFARFMRYDVR